MLQKNWMELIKPSKMDVNVQESDGKKGVLIAEPLERGFGLTLGNAIRRVLLSSLQGAAITSVKIKGIVHEFSTIPGVLPWSLINCKLISLAAGPRALTPGEEGGTRGRAYWGTIGTSWAPHG